MFPELSFHRGGIAGGFTKIAEIVSIYPLKINRRLHRSGDLPNRESARTDCPCESFNLPWSFNPLWVWAYKGDPSQLRLVRSLHTHTASPQACPCICALHLHSERRKNCTCWHPRRDCTGDPAHPLPRRMFYRYKALFSLL